MNFISKDKFMQNFHETFNFNGIAYIEIERVSRKAFDGCHSGSASEVTTTGWFSLFKKEMNR